MVDRQRGATFGQELAVGTDHAADAQAAVVDLGWQDGAGWGHGRRWRPHPFASAWSTGRLIVRGHEWVWDPPQNGEKKAESRVTPIQCITLTPRKRMSRVLLVRKGHTIPIVSASLFHVAFHCDPGR